MVSLLPEHIQSLIQQSDVTSPVPFSQKHWAQLPEWVTTVLGEDARILFGQVSVNGTFAQASWLVAGSQNVQLKLDFHAETRLDDNSNLDEDRSLNAAVDHLASILTSTDRDPQEIWAQGNLNDYGVCSVHYADNISAGRVVLVSGNAVVDIRGASSTNALLPLVRALLTYTTVESQAPRAIPSVEEYFVEVPEMRRGEADHIVKGTEIEFFIHCDVDARIATASAHVANYGILFNKCDVVDVEGGKSSTVAFTFITHELGAHEVELYFAEWSTMVCGTKKITVVVVADADEGEN